MLEKVLSSKAKVRLMRVLATNPGREFTVEELARETGLSYGTVHPAIASLSAARAVVVRKAGRSMQYSVNEGHLLYDHIKALVDRESSAFMSLAKDFARMIKGAKGVVLFGSAARGELDAGDLDLLVVRKPGCAVTGVDKAVDKMLDEHDAVVSPLVVTEEDVEERVERFDEFMLRVLDEGKLVAGEAKWLRS